jgi:hypothetical protein
MLKYNVKRTAPSKDSFISYLQHITPCPHTLATLMPSLTSKPLLLLLVRRNSHSIAQEQRRGQGEREEAAPRTKKDRQRLQAVQEKTDQEKVCIHTFF